MSLTFESLYPWLFSTTLAVLAWLFDIHLPSDPNLTPLLSAAISVSAILVGFLATIKSILMAMPGLLAKIRNSGYLPDLRSYITIGITSNLAFCAFNIIGFFPAIADWPAGYAITWIWLAALAPLCFWRVTRIMTLLFDHA